MKPVIGAKTAITRTKPSAPMRYLAKHKLLIGRALDFGCGKGFDANHFMLYKYDPAFYPEYPQGKFRTITCNYVLNVLDVFDQSIVLGNIMHLLEEGGKAYISVRRDLKRDKQQGRGCVQSIVKLDCPILFENSDFCIYVMEKGYEPSIVNIARGLA